MRLYFLRHGVAEKAGEWHDDDGLRPLTADGRTALVRSGVTLARMGLAVDVIVTSPLLRARQTAEIVGEALGVADVVVDDERLAPGFCRRLLREVVADHSAAERIMLVGHEPDFSATIGELIGGRVVCKKGGLARVDVTDPDTLGGELLWLLPPRALTLC